MALPKRRTASIAAETILLLASILNILIVVPFFFGARTLHDAVYIYFNVGEFALGAAVFVGLAIYLALNNATIADCCHLIPLAQHTLYHVLAFIVTYHEINTPHTDGDVVAALSFMIGMSISSIGACMNYLRSA